jgi:hypothetical protein
MTGFDACKMFQALKFHFFKPTFDYFRYKGSVSMKVETYEAKRSDERNRYERLIKKFPAQEDLENYIVANLIERADKPNWWIGNLAGEESQDCYVRWQGRTQAIRYNLIHEVQRLLENCDSFNALFKCDENTHPEILKAHIRGDVSLETFVVLDICLNFIPKIDQKLGDDRNWMNVRNKAIKYKPFLERLNIDVGSMSRAIQCAVTEMGVSN